MTGCVLVIQLQWAWLTSLEMAAAKHVWPKLNIISTSKEDNKKDGTNLLPIKSAGNRESYCLVPSRSPASALLKRGPG